MNVAAVEPVAYVSAVCALVAVGASIMGVVFSRKNAKEEHSTEDRSVNAEILRGTVAALQTETNRLQASLEAANTKAEHLNAELDAAQENVLILSEHIRRYLPERPFPGLRPMNAVRSN